MKLTKRIQDREGLSGVRAVGGGGSGGGGKSGWNSKILGIVTFILLGFLLLSVVFPYIFVLSNQNEFIQKLFETTLSGSNGCIISGSASSAPGRNIGRDPVVDGSGTKSNNDRNDENNKNNNEKQKRIIAMYSGPNNPKAFKAQLYEKNTDYFLKHGVDCRNHDTVLTVSHSYYEIYYERVRELDQHPSCLSTGHRVLLVARRDVCYDMESVRLLLYGGIPGVDIRTYDYFMYINCGVTGPSPYYNGRNVPWTRHFVEKFERNPKVAMAGLTLNCIGRVHIQTMVFALDKRGIDIVRKSGAVFDCLDPQYTYDPKHFAGYLSVKYERKMSRFIIDAGYAIEPLFRNQTDLPSLEVSSENIKNCKDKEDDIWIGSRLKQRFGGRIPYLNETLFFKTSRYLTEEIAKEINYTGELNWNWP